MKYIRLFLLPLLFFPGSIFLAQSPAGERDPLTDSLVALLETHGADTLRVNTLNTIAVQIHRTNPEEAILYGSEARDLAEKLGYRRGLAMAYKTIGLGHYVQSSYTEAFKNWESSLKIYEALGDNRGIANLLSNLSSIYNTIGKNEEAIEYNLRALKIAEELGDSTRIGTVLLNIGLVYSKQPATLESAKNYYYRAIEIGESIGYQDLLAIGELNLGEVLFMQEDYDSALFYFEKTLVLLTGRIDVAATLNYIGRTYAEKGDYAKAVSYHEEALLMVREENAALQEVMILLGLASTYSKQGDPRRAIGYYEQAKTLGEETGLNQQLSETYKGLADTYAELGDYQNAYTNLTRQYEVDNTIYRIEAERRTNNLMFSYQLEKKEDEIKILEQRSEIEQLANRRQRTLLIAVGLFGILLLVLAVGLYNRMKFIRQTNRRINAQKGEIESQRDQIQKQHDTVVMQKQLITDSISYAQRIQSAMLPSQNLLDELLPEHFIFFKPKDIVSGDFYWIKEVQDHLVIVGADCTGHGVPGAFMSMLGITLLNDLIGERCFDAPGAMLDRLRMKTKQLLDQEGKLDEQKDGMDMVIAVIHKKTKELHFSGANNPLYIVRNNRVPAGSSLEPHLSMDGEDHRLFELKGNKQPIGTYWEETAFTTHSVMLHEKDTLYMFSDGFVDQYGGENRKKYKSLNFKKFLLSIQPLSMKEQLHTIESAFDSWRGEFEQIDDVSVIGIRL